MLFLNPVSNSISPVAWSKMISSPQWKPPRSKGRGVGACRDMQQVSGRESWRERVVKGERVSPRPCRRRRTFWGEWGGGGGGGVIVRDREGGKSEAVGRRGMVGWGVVKGERRACALRCLGGGDYRRQG